MRSNTAVYPVWFGRMRVLDTILTDHIKCTHDMHKMFVASYAIHDGGGNDRVALMG